MHLATMIMLITIAVLGLAVAFAGPKLIGKTPAYVTVGTGLRTILIMGLILIWLIMFGSQADSSTVRLIASIMIAERAIMMIRYAGRVGQVRPARTWVNVSVLMFLALTDAALATLLLIFAW